MIKCRRKLLKISQGDLANRLGISKSYMSRIENHKFTNLTLNLIVNISDELHIDKHDLVDWLLKK